jgi:hypothetical protein
MPNLRSIDMLLVDDLFDMHGGFVLAFSDRTFAQFFVEELNLDIDDPKWSQGGTSKAKRLRYFLQNTDKETAARALKALWEYREVLRERAGGEDKLPNAQKRFLDLIGRLEGKSSSSANEKPKATFDHVKYAGLYTALLELAKLEPNPRGYAFERYLKELFDTFGLEAHSAFRLAGEQIDGSFLLGSETYLLEAKWHNEPTGVEELHAFHGKVEQKAAWSRGLFISYSGFSERGLIAIGRGKRVICLDGLDLSESLSRELPLTNVLERKVRRAAETGVAFVRVRDLFRE